MGPGEPLPNPLYGRALSLYCQGNWTSTEGLGDAVSRVEVPPSLRWRNVFQIQEHRVDEDCWCGGSLRGVVLAKLGTFWAHDGKTLELAKMSSAYDLMGEGL